MKIVDYQATPSGYYQIAFRNNRGQTITATQHGRGGCNLYTPYTLFVELTNWLDTQRPGCARYLDRAGFPDLATTVRDKGVEWQDIVVMSLCDMIDMGRIRVEG